MGEIGGVPLVFNGSKVGTAFSGWIELKAGDPVNLVSNPGESPAGIAMRAQNAVAAIARRPDKLRERIAENKAAMDAIKDRRQAPFPMRQMLAYARAQAQSLRDILAAEGGTGAGDGAVGTDAPKLSRRQVAESKTRAALIRIIRDGVTSPGDLQALLAVPGYSQWAQSPIVRNLDATIALRGELERTFGITQTGVPILNDQGVVSLYPSWEGFGREALTQLTELADRYGVPIAVRGGAALTEEERSILAARDFVLYVGLQEQANRRPAVLFSMIRPAGGITPTTPLLSQQQALADDLDGAGVKLTDVQAMADRVAAALPNLPGVKVLPSTRDAPPTLRAYLEQQGGMDDTEGAFYDGSIYLFAGNLSSMARAEHVLATHEAGHAGLAAILGADRARVMQSLLNLNDDLNRRARAVAKRLSVPATTAAEELLVDVAPAELVKLHGWRRVAHKVQQWLARSGFTELAKRMAHWLDGRLSEQQRADLLAAELMTAAREHLAGRTPQVRSMAVDAQQQARWLNRQAVERGYENADALALDNFDVFEGLTAQWRERHQTGAMLARRIVRGGYRTNDDAVLPETPEYEGNLTGDLAQVPAGKTIKAGPIRLPVGAAEGAHRGLGIEHMADNAQRDPRRMPKAETGDFAENLARQAVAVLRGVAQAHHDGNKYVFVNPQMKMAVVAAWRGDHYSITTVRPYSDAVKLWGNPEKVGRLAFPTRGAAAAPPSIAVAKESSLHPDRFGLEVASERFDFNTGKPKPATQVVVKKKRTIQVPGDTDTRLSRAIHAAVGGAAPQQNPTPAERADDLIRKAARTAQPLDAVARAITRATGVEWASKKLGSIVAGAAARYTPETIKAGLVSDYGLDPRVRDERVLMQARQQVQLRKAGEMIDSLASLTRDESAAAYRWMNETDPQAIVRGMDELPEGSVEKLQKIQRVIDKLSQEAVDLGQLDQRSYERNKFAYLHRSYAKHVLEPKGAKAARARAIAILGNQYKGRGTTASVAMDKVRQVAPEWWDVARKAGKAGKADPDLVGRKLTRYDRLAPTGAGTQALPGMSGRPDGRVLETVYLPAERAVPARYAEWRQGHTFEVRDVKRGELSLWRDWTADEREKMGEIDEARFAVAKTLHGMIRDVEVGRFLRWLSRTQAKPTADQLPAGAAIVEASESLLRAFKPGEWVQVARAKVSSSTWSPSIASPATP